jgi:S-ribosylhomocysteine lyase LuxS involved in autoinducer biosynthesis
MINDLSPVGVTFFLDQRINPDQEIELMIDDPINHTLKGTVVWCQEYIEAKHIISAEPYGFRVGMRFRFLNTEEESEFKKICEALLGPLACKTRAA